MNSNTVINTNIPNLKLFRKGKVRDVYEIDDKLLIVSTDRISAFDVVFPNGIPYKGKVLNMISVFWFKKLNSIFPNHFISSDVETVINDNTDFLKQRSMIVKKAEPIKIEAVVRGYLAGSALVEYKKTGSVCGKKLPAGLKESSKLPEPIFTPSTKADIGHDENITESQAINLIGEEIFYKIKGISLKLYNEIAEYTYSRGIIFADTKFEFGILDGELMLIDEVGTPDSSRFWDLYNYKEGIPQPSFDKQFVRDYLISIGWDKNPPAPELPKEIVEETSKRYLTAYKLIVGEELLV